MSAPQPAPQRTGTHLAARSGTRKLNGALDQVDDDLHLDVGVRVAVVQAGAQTHDRAAVLGVAQQQLVACAACRRKDHTPRG
jgi:hypothetical protein